MSIRTTIIAAAFLASSLAACLGGQTSETKERSDALGDRSKGVPPATLKERDWTEAAKSHGMAARFSREELADLEKKSAPGGNLGGDAGTR